MLWPIQGVHLVLVVNVSEFISALTVHHRLAVCSVKIARQVVTSLLKGTTTRTMNAASLVNGPVGVEGSISVAT